MSTATDSSSKRYEDCDSDSTQQELCTLKFGSHTYYTTTSKPTCAITGTNACKADGITNATKGITCQWCGDGTIQSGNGETCESSTFSSSTCYKQTSAESVDCTGGCGKDYKRYFDVYTSSCGGCKITWTKTGTDSKCYDSSSSAIGVTLCSF